MQYHFIEIFVRLTYAAEMECPLCITLAPNYLQRFKTGFVVLRPSFVKILVVAI